MMLFILVGIPACYPLLQTAPPSVTALGYYSLPTAFPTVPEPSQNKANYWRVKLGKRLFYDPILSNDSTISCASCHRPQLAFADSTVVSFGVQQRAGNQNVPSLTNIAYAPSLTRAGGVPTLEMQVLVPIQEVHELNFNIVWAAERLQRDSVYSSWSQKAYERNPDPYVITRALAAFERTLLSANSPYDQYYYYQKKKALSPIAKKGLDLFMSTKTQCSTCHPPPHFSDFSFKNNGLYKVYADSGRMRLTEQEKDRALFKVPSLRNITLTAPYMHDGQFQSLKEVIEHYNAGGRDHPHKDAAVHPLGLNSEEKIALEAFLQSLTDTTFINNTAFLPD